MNNEEREFIERLYLEMTDMLMAIAVKKLNDVSLAEEAVQDTFRIACMKVAKVMKHPNPGGWIVNTLSNTIKKIFQHTDYCKDLAARVQQSTPSDEMSAPSAENELQLKALYENWAEKEDFKFLVRYVNEYSTIAEYADDLGISVDACGKRLQRIKKKYEKLIKKN